MTLFRTLTEPAAAGTAYVPFLAFERWRDADVLRRLDRVSLSALPLMLSLEVEPDGTVNRAVFMLALPLTGGASDPRD